MPSTTGPIPSSNSEKEKGKDREENEKTENEICLDPLQLPDGVPININCSGSCVDVSDNDSNDSLSLYDMGVFREDLMRFDTGEELTHRASPTGTNISYPLASLSSTTPRNQTRSLSPTSPWLAFTTSSASDCQRSPMSLGPSEPYTYGSDDDDDNVSFGSLFEYDMAAEEPIHTARLASANISRPLVSPGSAFITRPAQARSLSPPSPKPALSTRGLPTRHRNLMVSVPPLRTQTRRPPTPPTPPTRRPSTFLTRRPPIPLSPPTRRPLTLSTRRPLPPPNFPQLAFATSSASDWRRGVTSLEPAGPPPVYTRRASPLCVVCNEKRAYNDGCRSFPTCGNTCARALEAAKKITRSGTSTTPQWQPKRPHSGSSRQYSPATDPSIAAISTDLCVVCLVKSCHDSRYVTCGLKCAEQLCNTGGANPNLCNYCHRSPKRAGHNQCSDSCKAGARLACLMCKSRPKHKHYHLCGKTCKEIAIKQTPLILEVPKGHVTYEMVEDKFTTSWKFPNTRIPIIQRIYKIIENKSFLQPYDQYKRAVGNEVFRYHGTTRKCTLGSPGNTQLCSNPGCPLCSILKTSFKTSLANPRGAFGGGVYSSSASNKAYSYTASGAGAMLLTKVVLGKVRKVTGWKEVTLCPPGFNSVVFERQNNCLNETIVYFDDAIRPVFLIMF